MPFKRYYDPLAADSSGRRQGAIATASVDDGYDDGSSLTSSALGAGNVTGWGLAPLKAVAMDSGTWPMDGGGVATCRCVCVYCGVGVRGRRFLLVLVWGLQGGMGCACFCQWVALIELKSCSQKLSNQTVMINQTALTQTQP